VSYAGGPMDRTCVLGPDRLVRCDSYAGSSPTSVVAGLGVAVSVACGRGRCHAATVSGDVMTWGWDPSTLALGPPTPVGAASGIVDVRSFGDDNGVFYVDGAGHVTGLSGVDFAVRDAAGSGAESTGAGGSHTCAIRLTDELLCTGQNAYGQLGTGTITPA